MTSRRVLKVAEAIREVVSMAILTDLRDPRIQNVTVTYVEVSADLRQAKVHVSVMGDDKAQQLSLRGLQNSAGYLQRKVGDRIETRYTPRLTFELDQGVKKSIEIHRLLGELLPDKYGSRSSESDGDSQPAANQATPETVEPDRPEAESPGTEASPRPAADP